MCVNMKGGTILGAPTEVVSLGYSELPYELFMSYLEEQSQSSFRFVSHLLCIQGVSKMYIGELYFLRIVQDFDAEFFTTMQDM